MSTIYKVEVIASTDDGSEETILSVTGTAALTALNLRAAADEMAPRAKPGRKARESVGTPAAS